MCGYFVRQALPKIFSPLRCIRRAEVWKDSVAKPPFRPPAFLRTARQEVHHKCRIEELSFCTSADVHHSNVHT
jgi:hypothetical protein